MSETVFDLARRDKTVGVPGGEKANFVCDVAADHLDMTVTEFSRTVVGQQVSESHVRKVLKEQNPAAFGISVEDSVF